jgi:hypothetical protein
MYNSIAVNSKSSSLKNLNLINLKGDTHMAESNGSGDIIIKGGSCELYFNHDVFTPDADDERKRKHATLNIKQIVISGDSEFANYDTGEHPTKFTGTIRIICK